VDRAPQSSARTLREKIGGPIQPRQARRRSPGTQAHPGQSARVLEPPRPPGGLLPPADRDALPLGPAGHDLVRVHGLGAQRGELLGPGWRPSPRAGDRFYVARGIGRALPDEERDRRDLINSLEAIAEVGDGEPGDVG
jgi:hypothetical protein